MSLRHAAARLSALLLLLALASGPAAAAGREEKVDVVIVGAGVSGLMAARTLEGAGHKVVVLEAQDRVGGRLQRAKLGSGDRTAWVDLGGQWMGTNHSRLQALVKELGIKSFDVPTGGKDTFLYDGRRTLHNYAWPSVPYNASQLERPWPEVNFTMEERDDVVETWKQVEALAATIDAERPWDSPNATELDTMKISTWVQVMCENWGGLGAFEPGAASMLHLAWSQKVSPQRQTPEAYLFDGAAGQLPIKLASQLSSRVRTGDPVDWIKQDDGGVTAVTAAGRRYRGKAAILAMPPHQTGRVRYSPPMPGIRDQLTQRSPMGAIIKVLVAYSTPWWRAKQLSGLAIGNLKTIELVADSTNPSPGSAAVLATFITGPRATRLGQASPESRKQAVLDDLAELLGEEARQPIDYREGNWPDNPWIGGAYTTFYTPGTWTQFGEALRRPVGRVFWAGTEMSTVWPGYIDGAIRAGEKAAQDASELL